jgi:hypothetical protein
MSDPDFTALADELEYHKQYCRCFALQDAPCAACQAAAALRRADGMQGMLTGAEWWKAKVGLETRIAELEREVREADAVIHQWRADSPVAIGMVAGAAAGLVDRIAMLEHELSEARAKAIEEAAKTIDERAVWLFDNHYAGLGREVEKTADIVRALLAPLQKEGKDP